VISVKVVTFVWRTVTIVIILGRGELDPR